MLRVTRAHATFSDSDEFKQKETDGNNQWIE